MPRGDKSAYTAKQKRKARHIEESYEERGLSEGESARRAWATVNKQDGGARKKRSTRKRTSGRKKSASSTRTRKSSRKRIASGSRKRAAGRSRARR